MAKEYKISIDEDWVSPEETLLDSSSDYSDLETPISNSVFRASFLTAVVLSVAVFVFIFDLSINKHDKFANLALQNKSVTFSVPPPRGIIFDRLGKPLVQNEPVFDLLVISKEFNKTASVSESTTKLAEVLRVDKELFEDFVTKNAKNNSIFFAFSGLNKDQVLRIKYLSPEGFYVVPNTKRYYIDGAQFSSVLGYIGKVNKTELGKNLYYQPTDTVGRLGIEAQYENYLRGEHGKIFFNAEKGDDENVRQDPVVGNGVVLNIDYDVQKRLYNELFSVLKNTSYSRAAAIVQNPQTGAIVAMVSLPSYDNNFFVEGLSEKQYQGLFENKSRPLFNRVISGLYNPGSTIKPIIGLMALEEKIFSPLDVIQNCIGLTVVNPYNAEDSYFFSNWRKEYGSFNLKKAIANSCNVFFYLAGGGVPPGDHSYGNIKGLGVERIAKYLKSSLADSKLGIDLPGEENGFVPTPDWKLSSRGEVWYQGDTYNISIGQGDLLVTPLWLNSYTSAIANGGTIYKPFIVKQILDADKNPIKNFEPEAIGSLNFSEMSLREVKNAMAEAVLSGTARILQSLPVKAGAKTGTAEVVKGRRINSIISAFAPFDNPETNITVLIEGSATNEGLALRTAQGLMNWYFGEYQR